MAARPADLAAAGRGARAAADVDRVPARRGPGARAARDVDRAAARASSSPRPSGASSTTSSSTCRRVPATCSSSSSGCSGSTAWSSWSAAGRVAPRRKRLLELFADGGIRVLGAVENMAALVCPHCGEQIRCSARCRSRARSGASACGGSARSHSTRPSHGPPVLVAAPESAPARRSRRSRRRSEWSSA